MLRECPALPCMCTMPTLQPHVHVTMLSTSPSLCMPPSQLPASGGHVRRGTEEVRVHL